MRKSISKNAMMIENSKEKNRGQSMAEEWLKDQNDLILNRKRRKA